LPWKMGPSRMVKVARSNEGWVERVDTRGAGARGVPLTKVAWVLVI
jgi:hypothetical protein